MNDSKQTAAEQPKCIGQLWRQSMRKVRGWSLRFFDIVVISGAVEGKRVSVFTNLKLSHILTIDEVMG